MKNGQKNGECIKNRKNKTKKTKKNKKNKKE